MPVLTAQTEWNHASDSALSEILIFSGKRFRSRILNRVVTYDVYEPEGFQGKILPLLLMNDGQDGQDLMLHDTLAQWHQAFSDKPFRLVAVYAGDRMQEYGIAHRPDYKKRGSKANQYASFLTKEFLPMLEEKSKVDFSKPQNAFIGFSLGGLSAFDFCWNQARYFPYCGVFSGSFWWRTRDYNDGYTEKDRIAHAMIQESSLNPDLHFWLQAGTHDESADRNGNGIIDAVEDTLDLKDLLESRGYRTENQMRFLLVRNGYHNPWTWARALPDFLQWWRFQIK